MADRVNGRGTRRASARRYLSSWRSTQGLSKRATLTSIASSLDYVTGITVQFIINPVLVRGLGRYLYGAWRVLYSLNGYLWAASGRSAQALTWVIANRQSSADEDEKRRYVASAIIVWFIFLPLLLLIGGLVAWFAPHFLKTPPADVWGVRIAAALLAADAIALTLMTVSRSVLQGENLGYKRMGLSAVLILLTGVFMALAIHLRTRIAGVAVANLLGTLLTGALFWRVAKSNVPWFGLARPNRETIRWLLGLSGWFTLWKLVFEVMMAGDVIVLGIFGAVDLVAAYTLTKFVAQSLVPLIGIVFEGTSPGLGGLIGRGDTKRAIQVRSEIMTFTWLLCTVVGAVFLLWNRSFVALWVGPQYYAGKWATLLIALMMIQFVFIGNDARIIDLTLKVRAKVLSGLLSSGLSIALAAGLMAILQSPIVGMSAGIIAGRTILTFGYPWLIGRALNRPLRVQLRGVPRPAFTTVLLFGIAMWFGSRVTAHSCAMLAFLAGLTAVGAALLASIAGMTSNQRKAIRKRARKILREPRARDRSAQNGDGR